MYNNNTPQLEQVVENLIARGYTSYKLLRESDEASDAFAAALYPVVRRRLSGKARFDEDLVQTIVFHLFRNYDEIISDQYDSPVIAANILIKRRIITEWRCENADKRKANQNTISLDQPVSDENDTIRIELVTDAHCPSEDEMDSSIFVHEWIADNLSRVANKGNLGNLVCYIGIINQLGHKQLAEQLIEDVYAESDAPAREDVIRVLWDNAREGIWAANEIYNTRLVLRGSPEKFKVSHMFLTAIQQGDAKALAKNIEETRRRILKPYSGKTK